jgi:hypothetical protein
MAIKVKSETARSAETQSLTAKWTSSGKSINIWMRGGYREQWREQYLGEISREDFFKLMEDLVGLRDAFRRDCV